MISALSQSPSVRVSTYLQDPAVEPEPTTDAIELSKLGERLEGPRVAVVDPGKMKASPDKDGNYLYPPHKAQFDQLQSFNTAQKTLDLFEQLTDRQLPWAFESPQLGVLPHAGEGANAYYVRFQEAVNFYSFESPTLDKTVHTAQSVDIVAHETGHAILDGLKPEWLSVWEGETKAFHEAFGDCAAMLLALSRPGVVEMLRHETGGDLHRDNPVCRLAEEFGTAVRGDHHDPARPYLRNANNACLYVPPEQLPRDGPRDALTAEPHSFANVFTGVFYRCLVELNAQTGDMGQDLGRILARAVESAAPSGTSFKEMARCMLAADSSLFEGRYQSALRRVFQERQLLSGSELEDYDRDRAALPALQKEDAPERMLQALGLDPTAFGTPRRSLDRSGATRVEFLRAETLQLGPGLQARVLGGLTLSFDPVGRLDWVSRQEITPERCQAARETMARLAPHEIASGSQLLQSDGRPRLARITPDGWLEPIPAVVD